MLIVVETNECIKKLPHKKEYDSWRKQISDDDYFKIITELEKTVLCNDVITAGWIPGHDWTGTVYEPIYYACYKNQTHAALFFGLIIFKLLMENEDYKWGFGRYEKNGMDIGSMTYFKIEK